MVGGYARFQATTDGIILGGSITFLSEELARTAMLHELGHFVGLTHSLLRDDVMYATTDRTRHSDFSDRELVVLRLMYRWRAAGNLLPDIEAGDAAKAAGMRTLVIEN